MISDIYDPFKDLYNNFNKTKCFLSGEHLNLELINVFPRWVFKISDLEDKSFKFLDESIVKYSDIKVPISRNFLNKLNKLDEEFEEAISEGYESFQHINPILIFQSIGKIVYGIIYNEIHNLIKTTSYNSESVNISQSLLHKFSNLQIMLQSIIYDLHFENFQPFSLYLFKLKNLKQPFAFNDDMHTLTASIKAMDIGLIINLQDNGLNKLYHKDALEKIDNTNVSIKQYEEICAKTYYSAYLFNRLLEYHKYVIQNQIFLEPLNIHHSFNKPLFDEWQEKVYNQVLEKFSCKNYI